MRKKLHSATLLGLVSLLLLLLAGCWNNRPGAIDGYLAVYKTGSDMGVVTFNHSRHKKHALDKNKCETCHHVGVVSQSCSAGDCHVDPKLDNAGIRIHETCVDICHKTNINPTSTVEVLKVKAEAKGVGIPTIMTAYAATKTAEGSSDNCLYCHSFSLATASDQKTAALN